MVICHRPWLRHQQFRPLAHLMSTVTMSNSTINFNFDNVFSSANRQRTVDRLLNKHATSKIENFVNGNFKRKAAILMPLCYDLQGRPSVLYNLRSKTMNKHKGQISFPGGAVDPEDNDDHVVTALRETEEELGISREKVDIWLMLPFVPTVSSMIRVAPVVGLIKEPVDAKNLPVNPDEVEFAFTVPLEHLCDPKYWDTTSYAGYTFPAWKNLDEVMGEEAVQLWGLTAMVTHTVLSELVPEYYSRTDISYDGFLTDKEKPKL